MEHKKMSETQKKTIENFRKIYNCDFAGGTFDQANRFIRYYMTKYTDDMAKKGILVTDKFEYSYYQFMDMSELKKLIESAEKDLEIVKFIGTTLKSAIEFIVNYERFKASPNYTKFKQERRNKTIKKYELEGF